MNVTNSLRLGGGGVLQLGTWNIYNISRSIHYMQSKMSSEKRLTFNEKAWVFLIGGFMGKF